MDSIEFTEEIHQQFTLLIMVFIVSIFNPTLNLIALSKVFERHFFAIQMAEVLDTLVRRIPFFYILCKNFSLYSSTTFTKLRQANLDAN